MKRSKLPISKHSYWRWGSVGGEFTVRAWLSFLAGYRRWTHMVLTKRYSYASLIWPSSGSCCQRITSTSSHSCLRVKAIEPAATDGGKQATEWKKRNAVAPPFRRCRACMRSRIGPPSRSAPRHLVFLFYFSRFFFFFECSKEFLRNDRGSSAGKKQTPKTSAHGRKKEAFCLLLLPPRRRIWEVEFEVESDLPHLRNSSDSAQSSASAVRSYIAKTYSLPACPFRYLEAFFQM